MLGKAASEHVISCAGASNSFTAHSDLNTRIFEVSVNDGEWINLWSAEELAVSYFPTNPGAQLKIELSAENETRVRLRSNLDLGLYVNPSKNLNEIDSNRAYVLFDATGNVIDPSLTANHDYSGRDFDDTSTTSDYAVYFRSVDFCLSPVKPITLEWRIERDETLYSDTVSEVEAFSKQALNITELYTYEGLEVIADQAFYGNKITSLNLAATVEHVGQNTFANNQITELSLGSGIKRLGNFAFADNPIHTITIHALIPPTIFSMSYPPFQNNPLSSIRVPAESIQAYKNAEYWSGLSSIITAI